MADQATVSGTRANGHGESVVGSIADLGNDVATLAELQAKLAAVDFQDCASRATNPLAVAAVGIIVVAGSVPVVVAAVGLVLAQLLSIAPGWGLLISGLTALAVAGAIAAAAASRVAHSLDSFRRSREELVRNLSWVRTVLVHSGRAAPKRRF